MQRTDRTLFMIDVSLAYVRQVLDQYLITSSGQETGTVILNHVVTPDGSMPQKNQNKVVITLINLEYETNRQYYGDRSGYGGQSAQIYPVQHFNLHVLISACFDEYPEALKQLTAVVGFFQENLTFTRENRPGLPDGLAALKFEVENSPSFQTHNLWTALGAKYQPSMIYKIRHVSVGDGQVKGVDSTIGRIAGAVAP